MKTNFYLLAVLVISSLTVFSACGDDDDNGGGDTEETVKDVMLDATAYDKWMYFSFKDGTSVAHEIEPVAGTYVGDATLVAMGRETVYNDVKLEVSRVEGDSLLLTIKDFNAMIGTADLPVGTSVAADTEGWSLSAGAENSITIGEYDIVVACKDGKIEGDNITLDMTIYVAAMMGGTTMPVTYKGKLETRTGIDETSFNWDIALHRYDVKTNGASAVETTESDIKKVTAIPSSGYVADIKTDSLIIDNSGMMNNKVGYATSNINEVLNKGIEFSSVPMPPTPANWTMSNKVYVIKLKSGEYAKIKFTDYSNDADVKGHISFEYVYPFK